MKKKISAASIDSHFAGFSYRMQSRSDWELLLTLLKYVSEFQVVGYSISGLKDIFN